MNFFPLWQMILGNKDPETLLNYKFRYTYGGKFQRNGDVYTTVIFHKTKATYVIDFGADHNNKGEIIYSTERLIQNNPPLSEILIFHDDDLFQGTKEILVFNEHQEIPVMISDEKMNAHCVFAPARFNYIFTQNGTWRMDDEKYYLRGKKMDKTTWERTLKLKKLKQSFKLDI